jgi:UDP-N-acetylglucosamine 4-epimerase
MHRPLSPAISTHYQRALGDLRDHPRVWLVTGVAGFIGSNLLEALLGLGQTVVGLDNFSTGLQSNVDEVLAQHADAARSFRLIRGDIRDLEVCREACAGVELVLHQAALGASPRSMRDPMTTNGVNVSGFLNLLVAARDARVRRVVYASSSSVYGDAAALPQVEDHVGHPLSPYAVTKCADELYAGVFQRAFGLEVVGLRYFSVFGRRQDPSGEYAAVIQQWIGNLLRNAPCRIMGDGEATRDYCYVANAVQANILAAMAASSATNEVYNVACGESTTLNELFRMIRLGLAGFTRTIAADPVYEPASAESVPTCAVSIDKARERLGYEPTHRVSDGLSEALAWYVTSSRIARAREGARDRGEYDRAPLEAVV